MTITLFQAITFSFKITSRTKKTATDTSNSRFTITNASGGDDDDDDSDDEEEEDVEKVLTVLEEVGSQENEQHLSEVAAAQALDALKPVPLPDWARIEAEELVDFLARREY